MAVAAAVDPARIAAVGIVLTAERPQRLLVAYLIGGVGVSLAVGVVVLFILEGVGVGATSSIPPKIEIGVGAFALLVAILIGSGVATKVRDRFAPGHSKSAAAEMSSATHRPTMEDLPGFGKLPSRLQTVLRRESPWVAWLAGVAVGMPSAYYLAAIAATLSSGGGAGTQVLALVVFNVIAFALALFPSVSFLVAPDATRSAVERLYRWMLSHQLDVVAALAAVVGLYLVIIGVTKL
ncbi:MAG: GAP family protein [Acidimicrobiaceae bacterium]|nr:GAP family protein [Acidimicrobiaceae bacterium]